MFWYWFIWYKIFEIFLIIYYNNKLFYVGFSDYFIGVLLIFVNGSYLVYKYINMYIWILNYLMFKNKFEFEFLGGFFWVFLDLCLVFVL